MYFQEFCVCGKVVAFGVELAPGLEFAVDEYGESGVVVADVHSGVVVLGPEELCVADQLDGERGTLIFYSSRSKWKWG